MDIYIFSVCLLPVFLAVSKLFKKKKKHFCGLVTLELALLIGLRSYRYVGVDLFRYLRTYNNLTDVPFFQAVFYKESGASALYYITCWIANKFSIDYQLFVSSIGVLCVLSAGWYIYQHSKAPMLSFLFYMGMGVYTFSFSGLRQAIAMSIVLLSFHALSMHKTTWVWVLAIVAILFHPTAVIYLFFLILFTIPLNKTILIIYFVVFAFLYAFRIQTARIITLLFDDGYVDAYSSQGNSGGTFVFLMVLLIVFLFLYINTMPDRAAPQTKYGYILIFSVVIQMFASYAYTFTRLNLYFMALLAAGIPYLFDPAIWVKRIGRIGTLIVFLGYISIAGICIWLFFAHIEGELLTDYYFFWET